MFRWMLTAGALAGLIAGLVLSGWQYIDVLPLIQEAETYEVAQQTSALSQHLNEARAHSEWEPGEGNERAVYTVFANVTMGVGFGLMLAAAMGFRGGISPLQGLLFGLWGYASFFVAPSFGLPPELPGSVSADLQNRQIWWLIAAIFTATGIGFLVYGRQAMLRIAGLLLILAPHLLGSPHHGSYEGLAPEDLANRFIMASAIANGLFWMVLGTATALSLKAFKPLKATI